MSLGSTAVFAALDASGDLGLWVTDGTAAGTTEIGGLGNADLTGDTSNLGSNLDNGMGNADNGVLYFSDSSQNLWETNGTAAGTVELYSTPSGLNAYQETAFIGGAVFVADDTANSGAIGLWSTDGTSAGTSEIGGAGNSGVAGAPQSTRGLAPLQAVQFGNWVLFIALDSTGAVGLWVTDGTAAGTVELGGLGDAGVAGAFAQGLSPDDLVVSGGVAFFSAQDTSGAITLWSTDGSTAGTQELASTESILTGQTPQLINSITATSPAGPIFNGGGLTENGADYDSNYIYLNNTGALYDTITASAEILNLDNALASIVGGGNSITFATGSNGVSLYSTSGDDDTVSGSNGFVVVNGSQANIVGGGDVVYMYGTSTATLSSTMGQYDTVYATGVSINVSQAQASVIGGQNSVGVSNGSTVSLYQTFLNGDTVTGSNSFVILTNSLATVVGGSDVIYMNQVSNLSLQQTGGNWDTVYGSHQSITTFQARTSVIGTQNVIKAKVGSYLSLYQTGDGSDTINGAAASVTLNAANAVFDGGSFVVYMNGVGSTAVFNSAIGPWNLVYASGDTVTLNAAQTSVVGGSDTIDATAGSSVSLYQTNGSADTVNGASESVTLTSADASIVGDSNAIFVQGANTLTLSGASEGIYTSGLFGTDTIAGFAATDGIQFTTADFANYAAVQGAMTQSGADTVITLDANDKITLSNVQMSSLTSSNFSFAAS